LLPPLHQAALRVQEDLVLMRKGEAGWRLAAASVCFPSSWNLREKFRRPMHEIHAPVPGFAEGTRNAGLIERMFDNLRVDMPVVRWNWSVYGDPELFHPNTHETGEGRFGPGPVARNVYLRLERQTLRKLPEAAISCSRSGSTSIPCQPLKPIPKAHGWPWPSPTRSRPSAQPNAPTRVLPPSTRSCSHGLR
jgi:hypothetical protein